MSSQNGWLSRLKLASLKFQEHRPPQKLQDNIPPFPPPHSKRETPNQNVAERCKTLCSHVKLDTWYPGL